MSCKSQSGPNGVLTRSRVGSWSGLNDISTESIDLRMRCSNSKIVYDFNIRFFSNIIALLNS
jgi:hypothetical protein